MTTMAETKSVAEICAENERLSAENANLRNDLRDRFAMTIAQGMLVCSGGDVSAEDLAEYTYRYADAMLKEREKYF